MNQEEHTNLVHDLMEAYADKYYAVEHNQRLLKWASQKAIGDILRQLFVLNDDDDILPAQVYCGLPHSGLTAAVFSIPV